MKDAHRSWNIQVVLPLRSLQHLLHNSLLSKCLVSSGWVAIGRGKLFFGQLRFSKKRRWWFRNHKLQAPFGCLKFPANNGIPTTVPSTGAWLTTCRPFWAGPRTRPPGRCYRWKHVHLNHLGCPCLFHPEVSPLRSMHLWMIFIMERRLNHWYFIEISK